MTMTNTISLEISDKLKSYSKIYAAMIKDDFQRKRAFASLTALYALLPVFEKTELPVQKAMTIFRSPELNEKYEISDFYVNDWHIDVRVFTEGEAFTVPKIHFDYSITPDFYAVVKVDKELKNAELIGFADTKNIKTDVLDYHYYSVENKNLISLDSLLEIVKNKKELTFNEEEHTFFRENYLGLVDNEIDENSKIKILQHLFKCPECRTEFCCFTGFEMVNCNIGQYPDILNDDTLNIVGAQAAENGTYDGKEEKIYIGDDNVQASSVGQAAASLQNDSPNEIVSDDSQNMADGETVSDILDELFDIEEDTVNLAETSAEPWGISEQNNYNDDLKYIDNNSSDILSTETDSNDFEMITDDDNPEELLHNTDDIVLLDENGEKNLDDNDIYADSGSSDENVDKVIVDYDETGEPIYSYITNINKDEDILEPIDDVKIEDELPSLDINDDHIEEDTIFRPMGAQPNNVSKDESEEEIPQNILNEGDNQIVEEENKNYTNESIIDYPEEDDKIQGYDNDIKEYNNETIDEFHDVSETDIHEEAPMDDNILQSQTTDDEQYGTFDNETELTNYNEDESLSDENYDEQDEDEISEYELDNDLGPEVKAKGSSKTGLLIALLIVLLSVPAAFFAMKHIKSATEENNVNAPVPNQNETYDMFEQPENQPSEGDLIPAGENQQNMNENNDNQFAPPDNQNANNENQNAEPPVPDLTERDLINQNNNSGDVNKVMADAFSQGTGAHVTINGVNWMCAPNLFTDKVFKSYLLSVDKALKMNLNKNILDATQNPTNQAVAIKIAIDNDGNLLGTQIANSSGSDEIDNIVLQSIKESLETQKTQILNNSEQRADKYLLKVVIKL